MTPVRLLRSGKIRNASDIDIGILPRGRLPAGFFGELEADIEESAIPYHVDLVDLSRVDPAWVDESRQVGWLADEDAEALLKSAKERNLAVHMTGRELAMRSPLILQTTPRSCAAGSKPYGGVPTPAAEPL